MTLTVRLDETLETALERYCKESGATKSLVVQESLATFLAFKQAQAADKAAAEAAAAVKARPVSANYLAFQKLGFIGAGELGGESATNEVVRARVLQKLRRTAE